MSPEPENQTHTIAQRYPTPDGRWRIEVDYNAPEVQQYAERLGLHPLDVINDFSSGTLHDGNSERIVNELNQGK